MTDLSFIVNQATYSPEVKAALTFVLSVATGGAILWLIPRTRKKARGILLPGFAGLLCFFVAFWNLGLIWRWHAMVQDWLISILPGTVVALTTKVMYPVVYLLGAWLLGFALAFQLIFFVEHRRKQKPIHRCG